MRKIMRAIRSHVHATHGIFELGIGSLGVMTTAAATRLDFF